MSVDEHKSVLAALLWDLHVPDGVEPRGQRGYQDEHSGRIAYSRMSAITQDDMLCHVQGETYLGLHSLQRGRALWLGVDVDTRDPARLAQVRDVLHRNSIPSALNFSGNKGYHFTIYLSHPARERELNSLCRRLRSHLASLKCHVFSGRMDISIPCGYHPVTGQRTGFVAPGSLAPLGIEEETGLLRSVGRLEVDRWLADTGAVQPPRRETGCGGLNRQVCLSSMATERGV